MSVKILETKDFNSALKESIVFIDFFAKWCGPCKMISPIVDELSDEITDVKFYKVDIDESSELASMLGVMSIPTLILFKDGKQIGKLVGFHSKSEITEFINKNK